MGEVIVITSGKGGVGKTTTTANIGTALAALGKSVVLVDGDTGLRNLDILLGLENRVVYNLVDVLDERCSLRQALIKDKRSDRLYLLPTAQTNNKNDIDPLKMLELVNQLKLSFDYVLIDCPAGIEQGFVNSVMGADKALVVVNPELTSIRDADRVIGMIEERNIMDIKLIINRIDYEMTKNGDMLDVEDIVNSLNIELIGIIIDDRTITIATNRGEPITLNKNSKLRMSFMRIAMRITGKKLPFKYDDRSDKSFSSTFRKLFASK